MDDYSLEPQWYVAHTYSGYENKVKDNIEKIVENRKLSDLIVDIRIPVETTVETDGENEKTVESKIFPSYVLVKMVMNDSTWHVIRNIRGVTGFVGPGSKPVALTPSEVAALGIEEINEDTVVKVKESSPAFSEGDTVALSENAKLPGIDTAKIVSVLPDGKRVGVIVYMFGRDTYLELDINDISPITD